MERKGSLITFVACAERCRASDIQGEKDRVENEDDDPITYLG